MENPAQDLQMNKTVPFVSDRIDRLSTFTNTFQSKDSYFKDQSDHDHIILPDLVDFLKTFKGFLEDAVGLDMEMFRNKRYETSGIPSYKIYFRDSAGTTNTMIAMSINQVMPGSHFSEEQVKKATTAYDIKYSFLGDLEVHTAIENHLAELDDYDYPRQEGVFSIDIIELYMNGGRMEDHKHHMNTDDFKEVLLSMYPGMDMREFLDAYRESDENIAIFIGQPGTGKTSLLKLILRETALSEENDIAAMYVKDTEVLHKSSFWTMLNANSGIRYLILDDLDHELLPRDSVEFKEYMESINGKSDHTSSKEALEAEAKKLKLSAMKAEQTIVNQLLSFSDGLFQNKMKVLLTTNLEDTKIDNALTRPGRCFDILSFPKLTIAEASKVWDEDFELKEESFKKCFADQLDNKEPIISQALLASEAAEIRRNRLKGGYLIDKGISVRNKYM